MAGSVHWVTISVRLHLGLLQSAGGSAGLDGSVVLAADEATSMCGWPSASVVVCDFSM